MNQPGLLFCFEFTDSYGNACIASLSDDGVINATVFPPFQIEALRRLDGRCDKVSGRSSPLHVVHRPVEPDSTSPAAEYARALVEEWSFDIAAPDSLAEEAREHAARYDEFYQSSDKLPPPRLVVEGIKRAIAELITRSAMHPSRDIDSGL